MPSRYDERVAEISGGRAARRTPLETAAVRAEQAARWLRFAGAASEPKASQARARAIGMLNEAVRLAGGGLSGLIGLGSYR